MKDLRQSTQLDINGVTITIDFTDKIFTNKLLKLIKRYQKIGQEIQDSIQEIDNKYPDTDENALDRLIAYSDLEVEILTSFKTDVDRVFGTDITTKMFGNCNAPSVERYFELFEELAPYIQAARQSEMKRVSEIQDKYLKRIK